MLERLVARLEKASDGKKSAGGPEIERDGEEDDPGVVDDSWRPPGELVRQARVLGVH